MSFDFSPKPKNSNRTRCLCLVAKMLETASLKSQQMNLDPSAWLDTIRDKREHMFLRDPTRSDQSQHICPSFFPTPRSICNLLLHHIFFFPFRLSSPSSPSPPVVSPLSSMLYSLGPSLGAAHSVHVPGMADRPDPFTRRFSSSSSLTPSLTPLPSTPLYICMRCYRLGCLVCTSVPFVCPSHFLSLPVFLSKMMREGEPEPFAFERVFYRMPHTHTHTHTHNHTLPIPARRLKIEDGDRRVCVIKTQKKHRRQAKRRHSGRVCVVTRVTHTHNSSGQTHLKKKQRPFTDRRKKVKCPNSLFLLSVCLCVLWWMADGTSPW